MAGWSDREPRAPAASVAHASPDEAESFAARWRPWAEGLGLGPDGALTVLGDGAAWVWAAAGACFPAAARVLDIFHASGSIAAAASALHGEGTAAATVWISGAGRRSWPTAGRAFSTTSAPGRSRAGRRGARRRRTR